VQTEEDAAMLRDWGVHYFQGHLYGAARIDHPWPSPKLASQQGFIEATEKNQDGAAPNAASSEAPQTRRRVDAAEAKAAPALQATLEPAAIDAPAMKPVQPKTGGIEEPESLAGKASRPDGEPPSSKASSLDDILGMLDKEMESLRSVLDSMHAKTAPQPDAPAREAI
jgi:hypothetical protein